MTRTLIPSRYASQALAGRIAAKARESQINLRYIDADHLGITLDETTKRKNISSLWRVFHTGADRIVEY